MCHIRTKRNKCVYFIINWLISGVISTCTNNSERDRKRARVDRKKIRLNYFFPSYAPQRKREPLSKDTIQVPLSKSNKWWDSRWKRFFFPFFFFSFLNWKHVVDVIVLLLWHHLVFRSTEYHQLLWIK